MKRKIILISSFIIFSLIVILSCNQPGEPAEEKKDSAPPSAFSGTAFGEPSSMTIGPAGGELSSPDNRFHVIIPAGALASNTLITIQPHINKNYENGSFGMIYDISPDGQIFIIPIQLIYNYSDGEIEDFDEVGLGIAYQTSDGTWEWIDDPVIDETAQTITISTNHFTSFNFFSNFGFSLIPMYATVRVGKTVNLNITYGLKGPVPAANITNWAVNGITGGNATLGTVSATTTVVLQSAVYTAPATKPTPAFVNISVVIQKGTETCTRIVEIHIIDSPVYYGFIHFWGILNESDGSQYIWNGIARLYFNMTRDDPGGSTYTLDVGNSIINFMEYTKYETNRTGNLTHPAGPILTAIGEIIIAKPINSYHFAVNIAANGNIRWVYKTPPYNVITEPFVPATLLISSPGGANPGFRNLGDGKVLSGEVTYFRADTGSSLAILNDWTFVKVE